MIEIAAILRRYWPAIGATLAIALLGMGATVQTFASSLPSQSWRRKGWGEPATARIINAPRLRQPPMPCRRR